jgi:hypothetical protein
MDEGLITYAGDRDGLLQAVDYSRIKLPAEIVMDRARSDPPPQFEPILKQDPLQLG